jgi:predicted nucleic acid-binding protein
VILLDTNYLIRLLVPGSDEAAQVKAWLRDGETLCTSAVCWYELACGPVTPEALSVVEALLRGGVLPLERTSALEAARLWNAAGRARSLRVDALIAGTALSVDASVATGNGRDFGRFDGVALS